MIYAGFESILEPEDNAKNYQEESYRNSKNMFLAVMAINQYLLMLTLVRLLSHTWKKMLFTTLLLVWSKKAITVVKW